MQFYYPSQDALVQKAYQTTLGRECAKLEQAKAPGFKGLLWGSVFTVGGVALMGETSSLAGVLLVIGLIMLVVWISKRAAYASGQRRMKWCENTCAVACFAVGGDPDNATDLFQRTAGGGRASMLQGVRDTSLEMLRQNAGPTVYDGAVRHSLPTLFSVPALAETLSRLGDTSMNDYALTTQRMILYHEDMSERRNRVASNQVYGDFDSDFLRRTSGASEHTIASRLETIEAKAAEAHNDILAVSTLDLQAIQETLYMAAQASPPINAALYKRVETVAQMAFGRGSNVACPDVMLAELVHSKSYSLERAKRETGPARQWIEQFLHGSMMSNDEKLGVVRSFCGALKGLELFGIEQVCLDAAEKQLGFLDNEMTARLDYLAKGGGSANARVAYYGDTFRQGVLPVDYSATQMNPADIDWLFNEVRGRSSAGARLAYGLAWKVTLKTIDLPSASIRLNVQALRTAIGSILSGASVSTVNALLLNTQEIISCLKIRIAQHPTLAYMVDISLDGTRVNVRAAVCWVPVSGDCDQQRQQCLQLWSQGNSSAQADIDKVYFAIETEIQRTVDRWQAGQRNRSPHPVNTVAPQPTCGHPNHLY